MILERNCFPMANKKKGKKDVSWRFKSNGIFDDATLRSLRVVGWKMMSFSLWEKRIFMSIYTVWRPCDVIGKYIPLDYTDESTTVLAVFEQRNQVIAVQLRL